MTCGISSGLRYMSTPTNNRIRIKTHINYKDPERIKAEGWKRIQHAHSNPKITRAAILISDTVGFGPKNVARIKDIS